MSNGWTQFDSRDGVKPVLSAPVDDFCYYEDVPDFVSRFGSLPVECQNCHKGLIFWDDGYSRTNAAKFRRMLADLPFAVYGKYNSDVAVFYFDSRENLLQALDGITIGLVKFGIPGRTQWRVSGRYWQDRYPYFFQSAKELDREYTKGISITKFYSEREAV